ncbi:hypothetical protein SH668x_001753 [Planctomicrobium sp. SH668]|uniref:hypothetical protein n=1 Tax=Planctomicrobium sp. SH668 TaxID=3448126 RepID=UPI003F5BFD74
MPAIIRIQAEGQPPREHWIQNEMMRIGSSQNSDLLIDFPNIEGHVLTLRFASGHYQLINRSGRDLPLGDAVLPAGRTVEWNSDDQLSLGEGISLDLVIKGSPEPSPDPSGQDIVEQYRQRSIKERESRIAEANTESSTDKNKSKEDDPGKNGSKARNLQNILGVFLLLIALGIGGGVVAMLVTGSGASDEITWNHPSRIGKFLLRFSDQLPAQLLNRLQQTEQSLELKDEEMARHRLKRLSDVTKKMKLEASTPMVIHVEKPDGSKIELDYTNDLNSYITYYLTLYGKE